ncbi:hypothetical protein L195_g039002, partial [Trifolium pratense]
MAKKTPSPYDLNSNDNPGNLITQVRLRGENYDEWSRAMKISLRARRKWCFIEGTIQTPDENSPEIEDWWTVQSMLVSWILNTIEADLRSTVSYAENARDLWLDIKERLSVVNGPRIQQLKLDLARCKQDGMSVVTYYGKLKLLWDDLANYDQIPVCSCGRCKCDISSKLEKRREEERVHQFLMGLDDAIYGTVRSNLLATDPLPNLNRVYSTMIQEERVKTMTRTTEERREVMSLAVQTNGRAVKGSWDGKDKCTHCHREGHEAGGCFQLVGYPDWWGDRPKIEGKYGGRGKPIQRSGTGRGRRGTARANAVHTGGTSSETAISQGDGSGLAGITAEQLQTLVGLLNAQKTNCNDKMTGEYDTSTWIIDTGCSNHMTGNLKHMRELQDIQSCPVGLPNGEHAAAVKQGSVVLEGGLKLTNVLFVPKLNCNLISVSQMMDELKCVIQFTNKLCVVQDRTSRTLIGAGERKDGLYFFRGVRRERTYKIDGLHPMDLWHKRLGHPSLKIT